MDNTTRDDEIVLGYLQGSSAAKLGRIHKLSVPTIRKILQDRKVTRKECITSSETSKVIDPLHIKVGQRLYHARFKRNVERLVAADLLGWSAKKLNNVEKGHAVLTLIDLAEISKYMETTISELTRGLE